MKGHAKLSPSAAHRWLTCTAAPTLEARYADETSVYALEGTDAHYLAELCTKYTLGLIEKSKYAALLEKFKKDSEFYDQEMQEAAEFYATYIKEKRAALKEFCPDTFVDLEIRLDLTDYIPEGFGTADCIIVAEPEMWVIDFKYGKGVKVEAEGNAQMEIYALGALARYGQLYDISRVNMAIVQPRLGGISEVGIDRDALSAWATIQIIPQAKAAYNGPGVFRPSEAACKFCKARSDCKARAEYFAGLFDDNDPLPDTLSPEEIGALLAKAAGMTDWLDALHARATSLLMSGTPVAGWKLVAGKSNRKYADEEAVARILKTKGRLKASDIYTKKLVGITAVEKLLGKKKTAELLGEMIVKPEGKPTLAPADDKRPEIFPADQVVNAFDEE